MSAAEKVSTLGIDLGTTYCCVGVLRGDEVELIPNDQGNINTPNYVAFTDTGFLVGDSAKSQATRNPSNTVFDIMRLIGNKIDKSYTQKYHLPYTVIENEGRLKLAVNYRGELHLLSPETIVAMVLKNLKKTAEHYIGHRVTQAVISVPANFNYCQRQAVKEAGHIIGLNVLKLINGPTAAALTYGLRHKSKTLQNVLIFDVGGGTANVSIVSISSSSFFEVLATAGDAHLGGEDFDNRLISHFAKEFQEKFNKSITENKRALNRLRAACQQVKKNLSDYETARIEIDALLDGINFSSQITRTQFDGLCYDLFTHTRFLFERTLHDANLEIDEIQEVVLVGGSSRIPFIQEMISVIFSGKTLNKSINPEEAVACGAALQGAILNKDKNATVKDVLLMDVAPFSLGVMSKCGEMDFFLKRGEPIPTRISRVFTTFSDNLPSMTVKLYEGECSHVKENTFIGSFYITKIPPAKKGVPQIQVIFDIDANCSLKVEFQDQGSGKMFTIHIDSNKERPKIQDIEEVLRDARPYKDKAKKQKRKPMPREDDQCKDREKKEDSKPMSIADVPCKDREKKEDSKPMSIADVPCKDREKKEDSKPMSREDVPCKDKEKKEDFKPMPREDDPCKDREKKKVPKPMPREDDPCKDREKKEVPKPMPREDDPCKDREKKKVPKPMPREDDPCKDREKKKVPKPMPREDDPCQDRLQQQELEQRLKHAEHSKEENRQYQEILSAKIQLENYVHSIKEKAESLLNTCNSTLEWLDSSSSLHEKEVYAAKIKKLQQSAFLMSGPYCQEQCDY